LWHSIPEFHDPRCRRTVGDLLGYWALSFTAGWIGMNLLKNYERLAYYKSMRMLVMMVMSDDDGESSTEFEDLHFENVCRGLRKSTKLIQDQIAHTATMVQRDSATETGDSVYAAVHVRNHARFPTWRKKITPLLSALNLTIPKRKDVYLEIYQYYRLSRFLPYSVRW
jgi:hypothetical protein